MARQRDKYSVSQYSISSILGFIQAGEIAIPEIQRPFVWKGRQVRDLIDSLYNDYPTGYLIIWQNPNVRLKNGKDAVGKKVLIDGQQRITALMTAIEGHKILTEDYEEKVIKIAFNPLAEGDEERFAVQTPAHVNSSKWIPDISLLFRADFDVLELLDDYMAKNPDACKKEVNAAITNLLAIGGRQIGAITLVPELDIREVTEIFVRINSQGKRLNEADFAMSKIAADERYGGNMLRKAIDYFCHLAADPSFYSRMAAGDPAFMDCHFAQRLKWLKDDNGGIYNPSYSDMLRVSFMHMFGRGKLGDLVSLLSGRDFADRTYKEAIAEESFALLSEGVTNFMNQYNFEQFILAIKSSGFVCARLLNSQMTLNFAYTLYMVLQRREDVPKVQIKRYIQKWFVLSMLTGRYINSPESQMDRDLRSIASKGFVEFFTENETALLSDTFWEFALVKNLETSSINSPYFCTYLAAQVFMGDRSLLSNSSRVADLITVAGDVHHIFPKAYLKKSGYTEKSLYNQVANFAYLDTGVNISVGEKAPKDYFHVALEQCSTQEIVVGTITDKEEFYNNLAANCIPRNVMEMEASDYPGFLYLRRQLMARKIKEYYLSL